VLIHPAAESDHDRILSFIGRDPAGWVDAQTYKRYIASGSYGIDRVWLAEADGRIVACAVWYGGAIEAGHCLIIDCLWVEAEPSVKAEIGAAVLRAGHAHFQTASALQLPEYHLFLKPAWRHDPQTCLEMEWRRAAAQSAGLTTERELLRYEWTPDASVEPAAHRLSFVAEPDDEVFLAVFRRVAAGTFDRETRDQVAKLGLDGHAREALACYRAMRGDRAWWRTAYMPDRELAGFIIPSANEDSPVIGYLGVIPEMRGRGYGVNLLSEATRILASNGASRIRSHTDVENLPMAAAFERAGYRNFGVRLVLSGSPAI
jgi:RimJ/RimL family protein N-acetyltransferase